MQSLRRSLLVAFFCLLLRSSPSSCWLSWFVCCNRIEGVAFSPSGSIFVSASCSPTLRAGTMQVWSLKTLKPELLVSKDGAALAVRTLQFNHNGSLLATGAVD